MCTKLEVVQESKKGSGFGCMQVVMMLILATRLKAIDY
jgi:hypothetical protein